MTILNYVHWPLTEDFADVGVVHVGTGLEDLASLLAGPDHEGVHGPLDVRLAGVRLLALGPDDLGAEHLACNGPQTERAISQ